MRRNSSQFKLEVGNLFDIVANAMKMWIELYWLEKHDDVCLDAIHAFASGNKLFILFEAPCKKPKLLLPIELSNWYPREQVLGN
jgi:hypothetical protein